MVPFLSRIEFQGFKSFAAKTVFEFPARITGIVGPNGSGKSNIVDGLRWVLGERGVKNLRGESLENLLFAGTPKKPASSIARVALSFSNRGRLFPFETDEIVVERRVDRSGASAFFINNAEARLRDILALFAKARLGSRGLAIIGQGQSDLFVKSSAKDRRLMIEEILGLKEYRLKKEEAERKLEASVVHVEKVTAMIDELEPHLKLLRRQKNRWDRRLEIESELRALEDAFFANRFFALRVEAERAEAASASPDNERKKVETAIQALEDTMRKEEAGSYGLAELEAARRDRDDLAKKRHEVEREVIRLETRLELSEAGDAPPDAPFREIHKAARNIHDELKELVGESDLGKIRRRLEEWLDLLGDLLGGRGRKKEDFQAETGADGQLKELKRALYAFDEKIKAARAAEEAALSAYNARNEEFRKKIGELERDKNTLRALERRIEELRFEKEKVRLGLDEVIRDWAAAGRESRELEVLARRGETIRLEMSEAETERRILRLRAECAAIGEIESEVVKEAEDVEMRFNFLTKERDDVQQAAIDLKNLIIDLESRIHGEFTASFKKISDSFNTYFSLMFGGGKARMKLVAASDAVESDEGAGKANTDGIEIEIDIPRKKIKSLDMLSGGEKSLVSLAALFALIAVSPPPFLVLDEIDAPLDEENARRFAELLADFSHKTQFIVVTHNRITMEASDTLYGITMSDDGVSKVLSVKLGEKS